MISVFRLASLNPFPSLPIRFLQKSRFRARICDGFAKFFHLRHIRVLLRLRSPFLDGGDIFEFGGGGGDDGDGDDDDDRPVCGREISERCRSRMRRICPGRSVGSFFHIDRGLRGYAGSLLFLEILLEDTTRYVRSTYSLIFCYFASVK